MVRRLASLLLFIPLVVVGCTYFESDPYSGSCPSWTKDEGQCNISVFTDRGKAQYTIRVEGYVRISVGEKTVISAFGNVEVYDAQGMIVDPETHVLLGEYVFVQVDPNADSAVILSAVYNQEGQGFILQGTKAVPVRD